MVTFGDESLNDRSENDNPKEDKALDALRVRLGKQTVSLNSDEPTRAQLEATGEIEPDGNSAEDLEFLEASNPQPSGQESLLEQPAKSLAITEDKLEKPNLRKYIAKRVSEGATLEDLVAEGINKRSAQTVLSELKAKSRTNGTTSRALAKSSTGMPIFAHGSPPEAIIDSIRVPDVSNGEGIPFEQGIKFGMSLIILGVRVAQELSGIGITQAKPILDMAKSMREGEALAAKNAAGEAAMEAASMVRDSMMPILTNLQKGGGGGEGSGVDPVKAMMVRTMEPLVKQLMGGTLGKLIPGANIPQLTEVAGGDGSPDGWTRKTE